MKFDSLKSFRIAHKTYQENKVNAKNISRIKTFPLKIQLPTAHKNIVLLTPITTSRPPMFSPPFHSPYLILLQTQPPPSHFLTSTQNHSKHHTTTTTTKCFSHSSTNPSSSTHFHTSFTPQNPYVNNNLNTQFANELIKNSCINSSSIGQLLQSCVNLKEVKNVHAIVVKCVKDLNFTYVDNNLISGYVRFGGLVDARKMFDGMRERNVVSWTAMLNGYLKFGLEDEALRLFKEFVEDGFCGNAKTFVCVLNLCGGRGDFALGKQVHGCLIKGGFSDGLILDSAIVHFYAQCGDLDGAFRMFDRMKKRDVVCWTTMITACSQLGRGEEAFIMFARMLLDGFEPNEFTVCSVLNACGKEQELKFGRQLHGAIIKKMYRMDVFVGTVLVDMYAKCGEIEDARVVFNGMRRRNTVTWTSMIAGYAHNGLGEEALRLFRVMKRRKIYANYLTMVSILRACGLLRALPTGKEVHAQIVKSYVQSNIYIGSALVWLYCKCGEYSSASNVLQVMPLRDVVSWTAMISGCAHLGHEYEALGFLKEMLGEGVDPNHFTYSSALRACTQLEDIRQGKLIHSSISKTPALSNVFVGSALINMYAKCGQLSDAIRVFDNMPEQNLVSWKVMVVAYAKNGFCNEALKLMYRMQAEGIEVDDYILATVLTACGDLEWKREPISQHCLQS